MQTLYPAIYFLLTKFLIAATTNNRLLIIVLDGFKREYLNYTSKDGGFQTLIREGVTVEHMFPSYPSDSYPGYYSITTGLWGEINGMAANGMYDPNTKTIFQILPDKNAENLFWWEKAEPLWITTIKNNISTASLRWPGAHISIHGVKPKIATPYEITLKFPLYKDLDRIFDLFASNEIQYGQIYSQFSDIWGHLLGPGIFTYLVSWTIDTAMKYMLNKVQEKGLENLNIVVLSDHGMARSDHFAVKTLNLENISDQNDIEALLYDAAWVSIVPVPGKEDKIYRDLRKLGSAVDIYWKKDLPDRFHIKLSDRIPEIFIVVKKGYFLNGLKNSEKQYPRNPMNFLWKGYHGFDALGFPDMNAIFIAWGPDLKKGKKFPPIEIVDPYNLFNRLLGLEPLPNNGTWSRVKDMIKEN